MNVPPVVALRLADYINAGGRNTHKARVMLMSMGWHADKTRASQEETDQARQVWRDSRAEAEEIPY